MTTTLLDFLHLNGYGLYVWPAFVFAAIVLVWMGVGTLRRLKAQENALTQAQEAVAARDPKS
ncbi:MAG: heme exporter protein CcmD [Alphaproteobacteria bacterium]|jgi:heme exporter protein CcmD